MTRPVPFRSKDLERAIRVAHCAGLTVTGFSINDNGIRIECGTEAADDDFRKHSRLYRDVA